MKLTAHIKLFVAFLLVGEFVTAQNMAIDTVYTPLVKTVSLAPYGNELAPPIIPIASSSSQTQQQLLLRFDILSEEPQSLRWHISHCSSTWRPDSLSDGDFISGPNDGPVTNYQSSFTTRTDYVNYYQLIPETYSYFSASGNYLLTVYMTDHPDSIILCRRFSVFEELTDIEAQVAKPSASFGNFQHDQQVDVAVTPRQGSFLASQPDYYKVIVQQNRRNDLRRLLPFHSWSRNTMLFQWNAENIFPGGNTFRYFDISNLYATMYHVQRIDQIGNEICAFLQPDEIRARKPYTQYNSLNGGTKTNVRDRNNPLIEAEYVWVNFSLPMQQPYLNGSLHIIGDLTDWNLGEISRMNWNKQYRTYTKRLLLKQGYYSYQILFLPSGENEALTATIEGDHTVMPNDYYIFIYYSAPGSRFDRLVGFRQATIDN